MMFLVLDLECVRDETLPEPRDPNKCEKCKAPLTQCMNMLQPAMYEHVGDHSFAHPAKYCLHSPEHFPPPAHWQIVTLGYALIERDGTIVELDSKAEHEAFMLQDLFSFMNPRSDLTLVGWNSRGYDCPVMVMRGLRHGLSWPWYYGGQRFAGARYRYSYEKHWDVADMLSDHGACARPSLNPTARLVGLPGKIGPVDGASVKKAYEEGRIEEIRAYNACDVAQTWGVALRALLMMGKISNEWFNIAAGKLCSEVHSNPLLEPMFGKIEGRFLVL